VVEMTDQDSAAWEIGREEARREIDVDQQLAEYQVAVFDMLDEAMGDGPWSPIDKRQEIADHLGIPPEDVDLDDGA